MRTKKTMFCSLKKKLCLLVSLFLFVASVLHPGISPQDENKKRQDEKERKSLIMKELLIQSEKSLASPKRNIFTRQRLGQGVNEFSPLGDFQSPMLKPGQEPTPDQETAAMGADSINVQYIGYVQSGRRVVALIILEGQTYAVESGDVLEMGLTIGEITPDDMEIIDRGSEPKRINLEGEKP